MLGVYIMNTIRASSRLFKFFLLVSFVVCQDIRPVEPFTVAVIGASAVVARSFLKSSVGKFYAGYLLGKVSQNPAGKYMIAHMQRRVAPMLQKRAEQNYLAALAAIEAYNIKSLALRVRMAAMVQTSFKRIDTSLRDQSKQMSVLFNRSSFSRPYRDQVQDIPVVKNESQDFKNRKIFVFKTNVAQPRSDSHKVVGQQTFFGKEFTFISADAATVHQFGRAQFWKGLSIGGFTGAATVAWWHKNQQDRSVSCLPQK